MPGEVWGAGRDEGYPPWPTAFWFDGRTLRDGELGTGGGGICCDDALREADGRIWGDGGTELRSGIVKSSQGGQCDNEVRGEVGEIRLSPSLQT